MFKLTTYRTEPWDILQHLFKTEKINNHVIHFSGTCSATALSLSLLKEAAEQLIGEFPLIRCNLKLSGGRRPVWTDRGYTAEDLVYFIPSDNAESVRNRFLLQEIDPEDGPQMKIALIRTASGDELCVIVNHMLCDADGFKELLYRLAVLYTALEKNTGYSARSLMDNRTVEQIFKTFPLKKQFSIYLHKQDLSPRGKQKFLFEGSITSPFIESRKIPREQFRRISRAAKAQGASINDVMMTAYIRTLSGIFGKPDLLPCAIDVRRFLPDRSTAGICNLMTNISCTIGPEQPGNFRDTLGKVKVCMDRQKNDPGCMKNLILLERLFTILPYRCAVPLLKRIFNNPYVAFTNIGILDKQKLMFGTTELTGAFMTGSIKYRDYFQLSLSTFDDEAVCCVNLYGTENDRKTIASFLDMFITELDRFSAIT
jgi:NRPS condensation-like uncharacterized protein